MQTDAHNMGREERRALLEQRRAAVARQLRRLAIELADLDRQLDEIEQSERCLKCDYRGDLSHGLGPLHVSLEAECSRYAR